MQLTKQSLEIEIVLQELSDLWDAEKVLFDIC